MKAAFVTNLCTHYRAPLFEAISKRLDVDFFLTSKGNEWYTLAEYQGEFAVKRTPQARQLWNGLRGYDVVLANLAGRVAPLVSYLAARARGKRFVLWVGIWAHPGGLAHRLSRPLARFLYRRADAVVCYGTHVVDFVRSESGRTDNVVATRQAVDDAKFRRPVAGARLAAVRDETSGLPLVTFVGRFEEDKGLDVLLRASASCRRSHRLVLIGKGSLESSLRAVAGPHVIFPGYVSQDDLPAWLQASDILVLPSVTTARFREPWGLILNEGMAAGAAVVATTAVGAVAGGLVVNGETGLVVPEQDAHALAAALDRLLDDDVYRRRLATAGSEHVRAWSFEAAADVFVKAMAA
jgi:glycosyltransferase involved in cell wall biosynthesis